MNMSREIKFRAISVENNNFIYGVPIISGIHAFIVTPNNRACNLGSRVEPETVSQYTGLKDKNDVEIYEGDIVSWSSSVMSKENWVGIIEFVGADCAVRTSKKAYNSGAWLNSAVQSKSIEVIGNIYENPELLKEDTR